jgi:plasmid maintenance system antidote protein VapI
VRFREVVAAEFARRQNHNPRYSLRAYARVLRVHHATLSRLLNNARPVPSRTIALIGPRLGLSPSQLQAMIGAEDAAAVILGIQRRSFRPDSRWLASVSGIPVDRVNVALDSLIRGRRLQMRSTTHWSLV